MGLTCANQFVRDKLAQAINLHFSPPHDVAQLAHRIDILLDVLARVPGSCTALGRLITSPPDRSDQECSVSLSEQLRWHIEKSTSVEAK